MRKHNLHMILAALLLGMLPALMSCSQKEIIFPEIGMAVLDVKFEWPAGLLVRPHGMTLWFFSHEDDGLIWRFDIAGADGGPIELPYGEYTVISCNNDVAAVRISNQSAPRILTASLEATDSIVPDITPLYSSLAEDVSFTPAGLHWTEEGVESEHIGRFPSLLCHPSKVSTSYVVELRDVHGLERMQSALMTFHGVCSDLLLYDGRSRGQVVDVLAKFNPPDTNRVLTASFESFGPLPNIEEARVEVYVTLNDRRVFRKTFDVAPKFVNYLDSLYVKIVIEGLSIPDDGEPAKDDVGMQVGVDGWIETYIDYTTGP